MRDWTRYVREHLRLGELESVEARGVIEEVASQLEDVYEAARAQGAGEAEAEAEAASHVGDWEALAREIQRVARSARRPRASRIADRAEERARGRGRGGRWMADVLLDVRYAWRTLGRSPGFAAVVVLLIGLGVGANTAIFSVLKAVFLEPLPYPEPHELAVLWETTTRGGRGPASFPNYLDWKAQNRSFEHVGALGTQGVNLAGDVPALVRAGLATSSLFDVFGVAPVFGRVILPEEDATDARVVVLSHELWASRYDADPGILGRSILLSGEPHTVVGVMPRDFKLSTPWDANDRYQLWVPFPAEIRDRPRDSHSYPVFGRLRDGVTWPAARDDMERVALNLAEAYPETNLTQRVRVRPLHAVLFGDVGEQLFLVLGAAGLVLLIACGNVAGLLLARGTVRRTEIAVRAALGAGRGRVVRQLLTESGLLALAGGAVAVLLTFWGLGALRGMLPATVPRAGDIRLDATVLVFALVVSALTGLVFGLAPALAATRASHVEALKEGGGRGAGRRRGRLRNGFVVAQLGLTLMLVHGTALLVGSYLLLRDTELSFDPDNVLTTIVALSAETYDDVGRRVALFDKLVPRLEALPGVRSAAVVNRLPLEGGTNDRIIVEGREIPPDPNQRPLVERKTFVRDYLRTMGIPLRAGRTLTPLDSVRVGAGVLINERMAEQLWPGEDPLGKRFSFSGDPPQWLTVVGVVANVRQWGVEWPAIAEAYRPYPIYPQRTMYLILKTDVEPLSVVADVRRAVLEVDPNLPVTDTRTMDQVLGDSFVQRRFVTGLIGLFAVLALVLAIAGFYGVISYFVAQRSHELGVRMALGAGRGQLLRLVLARGLRLTALGILLGTAGALAASFITRSALYGLSPVNPWFVAGVALLLLGVAVASTMVPARRATTVDPARALQAE